MRKLSLVILPLLFVAGTAVAVPAWKDNTNSAVTGISPPTTGKSLARATCTLVAADSYTSCPPLLVQDCAHMHFVFDPDNTGITGAARVFVNLGPVSSYSVNSYKRVLVDWDGGGLDNTPMSGAPGAGAGGGAFIWDTPAVWPYLYVEITTPVDGTEVATFTVACSEK